MRCVNVSQLNQQSKYFEFLSPKVAEYESTTFSIFYNNALFLALVIIASFYILSVSVFVSLQTAGSIFPIALKYSQSYIFCLQGSSPHVNYILSIGLSSGLIALLSTGTQ